MSKQDIRSFFSVQGKTGGAIAKKEAPKKRLISSSDEENGSREKAEKPRKETSKKRRIIDSDDEGALKPKTPQANDRKKPNLGRLKEKPKGKAVDIANAFGTSPVKRVEKDIAKKPVINIDIPSDDEFEKSIVNMEVDGVPKSPRKSPRKKESPPGKTTPVKASKQPSPAHKPHEKATTTMPCIKSPPKATPVKPPVAKKPTSSAKKSTKKETTPVDLESSVQMDEDRHEKKQMAAALYQKYKNRANCLNHGCKEIPKGRPNCLAGKIFLVTGILESLERAEAEDLIKEYGGKTSSGVTKKLNFMVVGEDAGPSKLVKAEDYGVKIISENDLLDMIRGGPATTTKKEEPAAAAVKQESSASPVKKKSPEKKRVKVEEPEFKTFTVKKKVKVEEPEAGPSRSSPPERPKKPPCDEKNLAWVDKYKPTSTKQIIGQQGPSSNTSKLLNWLTNWHTNHDGKKKLAKPSPWAKNDDGAYFKAALLSGPPGIGKTTTATLVCKELGYDTVEFNASDTRSKRLLKEQVSEILKNKSLFGYVTGHEKRASARHVLLMDEVDGMAGNEDRGGMAELIALIKDSSIPIICMCNDRQHQKMRSLVNYCFDLRFQRPRLEQIKGAMMSVCFKEGVKVDAKAVEEIIAASNNDIRQTINYLAMLSAGRDDTPQKGDNVMKKDLKVGPWEVVRKVFSADEHKTMSIHDKADLFFQDYSMGPLFVQENYLQVLPAGPKDEVMFKVAKAASSLSRGDLIERRIRSNNNWSVLPVQAMFSSVIPGEFMSGRITGQINFPGWLGKNSKRTKRSRMAQEIHDHTRVATSGSRTSVRMDYAPFILAAIVGPLKEHGVEGVPRALEVMRDYRISREDIDSLVELTAWPGVKSPFDAVESKVKAALTRAYNKEALAFVPTAKKKTKAEDEELLGDGEEEEEDGVLVVSEDEEDAMDNDAMIKQRKKPEAKGKAVAKEKPVKKKAVKAAKK